MRQTVVALVIAAAQAVAGQAGGSVSGHVVDAVTRVPVASATVVLIPPTELLRGALPRLQMLTVQTDDRGGFVFANIMPGSYAVEASGDGYVSRMAGAPMVPTVPVQVAPGGVVEGLELAVSRGGSVSGRVVGPDRRPISAAMVFTQRRVFTSRRTGSAAPPPEVLFISLIPRAQADGAGKFVLEGLAPGEYFLRATATRSTSETSPGSGWFSTLVPTYYPSSTDPATGAMPVIVAAGDAIAIGDITMHEALAVRVSGTTRDNDGKPMAGVSVRLVPPRP